MDMIDQSQKTLVFCATQDHARAVRDLVNQMKTSKDPNYCVRVTAKDGALGDQFLRTFQDNEKTIPTILTTSQKLSTGVDARNVRNIVLMRPINSMIEFKQIIGRGTRLFDGKDYFTIYDFVRAYEHFSDPEWDGEPMEPVAPPVRVRPEGDGLSEPPPEAIEPDPQRRPAKINIKLADGKERTHPAHDGDDVLERRRKAYVSGRVRHAPVRRAAGAVQGRGRAARLWSQPDTRKALLDSLAEKGYGREQLREIERMIDAEKSDLYDVLAYIAFALAPITRQERADASRPFIASHYDPKLQAFLDFVLSQYVQEGVGELDQAKLPHLLELRYRAVSDAAAELGGVAKIREAFVGFQPHLYAR